MSFTPTLVKPNESLPLTISAERERERERERARGLPENKPKRTYDRVSFKTDIERT